MRDAVKPLMQHVEILVAERQQTTPTNCKSDDYP